LSRRRARELAFRILFQMDVGGTDPELAFDRSLAEAPLPVEEVEFARDLVQGVWEKRRSLDAIIQESAVDWSLERMARVDINLLRLALYEMYYRDDIPVGVSINEVVELAKRYSTSESGKFINGILGNLARRKTGSRPDSEREGKEPDPVTG